ncbi:hypothetical protein Gotri_023901, partial [Gossypium trilobum]|nr:hypothetical protein [Gossypium trilobum]
MEAADFFVGGYYDGAAGDGFLPEQKPPENFTVDDLLDFSNEDAIISDCFLDNYDDLAELEWLSNFVEDSFSTDQNLQSNLQILASSKSPTPESSSSSTRSDNNPIFQHDIPHPAKARSKRSRAPPCDWSTRVLHLIPKSMGQKKRENSNANPESSGRKCLHCAAEKTPQWRTGPMGPKTLCNAKVLELRRQKDLQRAQHQQFLSQTSIFGISNGGGGTDDLLIHHH